MEIRLGDSTVRIITPVSASPDGILFINVHEDEITSIETVLEFAKERPLNFVRLAHIGTRNVSFSLADSTYTFDPNRIFSKTGRKETLAKQSQFNAKAAGEVKKLAMAVVKMIPKNCVVVAMHNNTDVNYNIRSYEPGGDEAPNTKEVYVNPEMDPDDFIYTTVVDYFESFKSLGINVILQNNENCIDDGSLSVYCGKKKIPYINIEAQLGHFEAQLNLIAKTIQVIEGK